MRRRLTLSAAAAGALDIVLPRSAAAQARAGLPRVGLLSFGAAPANTRPDPARGLARGLQELGYVEGRNLGFERRFADGDPQRLTAQAQELVALKVDVILAGGPAPLEAARKATQTIPIVTVSGSDPVREGWAQSLARPGGNVTGLTVTFPEIGPKSLELLKEAVPGLARMAVLRNPDEVPAPREWAARMDDAVHRLGLQVVVLEVRVPDDFEAAFRRARQQGAQALFAEATNTVVSHAGRIAALALRDRLPSMSGFPRMVNAGFMMSYGADLDDLLRRSITWVDKILKGARAGELPIERPTKFQLVVSLRTARALGVTVPAALLLRADEVIE